MNTQTLFNRAVLAGLLLATPPSGACAGEQSVQPATNRVYTTTLTVSADSDPDYRLPYAEYSLRLVQETLSADQDPAGNWGAGTNGIQMSLRFYNAPFTNGQPVCATILVRNVGTNRCYIDTVSWENYHFDFYLSRDGAPLKPVLPRVFTNVLHEGSGGGVYLEPGKQWRFSVRMEKIFDLTRTGTYQLVAERAFSTEPVTGTVFRARTGVTSFLVGAEPAKPLVTPQPPAATNQVK